MMPAGEANVQKRRSPSDGGATAQRIPHANLPVLSCGKVTCSGLSYRFCHSAKAMDMDRETDANRRTPVMQITLWAADWYLQQLGMRWIPAQYLPVQREAIERHTAEAAALLCPS